MEKSRKWLEAVTRANRARRGIKRTPSLTRSTTLEKFWSSPEGKRKAKALGKARSVAAKKRWASKEFRKRFKGNSGKMRSLWADPKFRAEMEKKRRDQVNEPGYRAKLGNEMRRRWADPVWRAKMCKIRKTQSKGNQARSPNASFYRTRYKGKNGSFWMRSSWEVKFALWMDSFGVEWTYEEERIWLSRGHYYRPDFYLPNQRTYVEIKGWMTKESISKLARVKKLYPDLMLWVFEQRHLKEIIG